MDDIHSPTHTPMGPGDTLRQIYNLGVRFGEADVQVFQQSLGEPAHILRRASHEVIEVGNRMFPHELGQMGSLGVFRARLPHYPMAEAKLGFVSHFMDPSAQRRYFSPARFRMPDLP